MAGGMQMIWAHRCGSSSVWRRRLHRAPVVALFLILSAAPAAAQSDISDPYRFWKWPANDVEAFAHGLTSHRALYVLGGGALLLLSASHDPKITEDLSSISPASANLLVKIVEEFGNAKAVHPMASAIFIGTLFTDDRRLQDAAFTSLEATVLANIITNSLKSIVGRARPLQEEGATTFKPFSGNSSFPSGHSTTAFAVVTPWLLYYPNAFTPGLLVLGAGTAFTRMLTNNHWFTDVVAGSAVGFFTAYFLVQRHQADGRRVLLAPSLGLQHAGVTLTLKID